MDHIDILAKFLERFPQWHESISAYSPAGPNSIIVEFRDGTLQRCRFTYNSDRDWYLRR